jgi:anti-sigma B factor antagonist
MGIREDSIDGVTVLTPDGDMDLSDLPAFEARVETLLEKGARDLVWELDAVGILPSTAVGFLLQTRRRVHTAGGRMVLACGQARVLSTLRTMGVLEILRTYPTRAEALAALS